MRALHILVKSDLHRLYGKSRLRLLFYQVCFGESYKIIFWYRMFNYLESHKFFCRWPVKILVKLLYRHYTYKFGISLPPKTKVGYGFYIGHFGGLIINQDVTIGNNCNLSHNVTIGKGTYKGITGCPNIKNNVYIGPGVKIFGPICIGNNVCIGANAVVNRDIPDNVTVGGIPARIISENTSKAMLSNIVI
jgi:serine O-acetyltransferase